MPFFNEKQWQYSNEYSFLNITAYRNKSKRNSTTSERYRNSYAHDDTTGAQLNITFMRFSVFVLAFLSIPYIFRFDCVEICLMLACMRLEKFLFINKRNGIHSDDVAFHSTLFRKRRFRAIFVFVDLFFK